MPSPESRTTRITGAAKRGFRRAAQLLAMAGLFVGFGELIVRALAPQRPVWLDLYARHPRLPFFALQPHARRSIDTRETNWSARLDGEGHRTLEDSAANPGAASHPLILWLGDSFTFGYGIDYPLTFVSKIDARGFRSLNTGVPGYGPAQYRQILEDVLGQGTKPLVVVVMTYLGNDFDDCVLNKDLPVVDGVVDPVGGVRSLLQRRSHFYRLAMKAYLPLRRQNGYSSPLEAKMGRSGGFDDNDVIQAMRRYREEFARIQATCAAHALPLAVALIPSRAMMAQFNGSPLPGSEGADFLAIPREVTAMLSELGIRHLDLTPALGTRSVGETYFNSDGHFTALGHDLVTEALVKGFAELGGSG